MWAPVRKDGGLATICRRNRWGALILSSRPLLSPITLPRIFFHNLDTYCVLNLLLTHHKRYFFPSFLEPSGNSKSWRYYLIRLIKIKRRPRHPLPWWKRFCSRHTSHAWLCACGWALLWYKRLACKRPHPCDRRPDRKDAPDRRPIHSSYHRRHFLCMGDAGPFA